VAATASKQSLQPRESGYMDVSMDARRFTGTKSVSIYVTVGPQYTSTATLHVAAVSRPDVVFNPGEINFGVVPCGQKAEQAVDVEYAGSFDWKVTDIIKNGAPLEVDFEEIYRRAGQVGYRIRTTLKPDASPGLLRQELLVKTNDPASPLVPLLVEATVQASLSAVPNSVNFGQVKLGETLVKKVIVKGNRPFRITGVDGLGDGIDAELPLDSATVQTITLKFQPIQAAEIHKKIRIRTDLDRDAAATVSVEASVSPG
jgi:hypothetical protein